MSGQGRSRLPLRARLTLVYGGLFLLAGVALLFMTQALLAQRLSVNVSTADLPVPLPSTEAQDGGLVAFPPPTDQDDAGARGPSSQFELTRQTAIDGVLTQGAIALVVVVVAATTTGWVIAGRLLRPLHRITETARRIANAPAADRGLHERIALDGPRDEVRELADTFDAMLQRLDQSFDSQRRFIANASHELRTPLTLNRALLQVALHRSSAPSEFRDLGETLLDINGRHERLIEGLLLLAQSERELEHRAYVDLADVVEHVVARTPADGVEVIVDAASAPTSGEAVLLEHMVRNLVHNAVRHNTEHCGWVRVGCCARPDGHVEVRVSNSGPVVAAYEVPTLFEPFRRLGQDRVSDGPPGVGLGLSIVRAVVTAHHGHVRAAPRPDGGLDVTVTLPRARDEEAATDAGDQPCDAAADPEEAPAALSARPG